MCKLLGRGTGTSRTKRWNCGRPRNCQKGAQHHQRRRRGKNLEAIRGQKKDSSVFTSPAQLNGTYPYVSSGGGKRKEGRAEDFQVRKKKEEDEYPLSEGDQKKGTSSPSVLSKIFFAERKDWSVERAERKGLSRHTRGLFANARHLITRRGNKRKAGRVGLPQRKTSRDIQ